MEMKQFKALLQNNFAEMTKEATHLFEVALDKDELWNVYLDSFPSGTNKMFREKREYDCSCCRQFVKNIGNAVVIKNNKIITVWDFVVNDETFQPVLDGLSTYVKSKMVADVYVSKLKKVVIVIERW